MSTVFTNTFGGSAVSPADVAYAAYTFSTDLVLFWPQFSAGQTNVAARFMNLDATAASRNVFMPDAELVSVGQDVIIFNAGSDTFNVVDFNGGAIATIASGQTYYIILNDNTTQAGTWQTVQFGVGTGSASAAALAGAGLLAVAGMLNVNFNATLISSNTTLASNARAILQVWTGGAGTINLPDAGSVGDGFFFPLANDGSGSVTIQPVGGQQIDGAINSIFTQTQSAFIVSSGSAWYTVGKGLQTNFAVTILNLNVAGSSNVTETSAQAQNIIQQFTGILTGNINVIVPNTVQLYYAFNNTTGPFTLTMKTAAGSGIIIAQGSHVILYCDGTNVVNAFTSSFGGALSIDPGSSGAPNLNFIGSTSTGIYSPATNQLAITANGKEVANFISDASAVNYLQLEATATGSAPIIAAQGTDANIGIILSPKGSGAVGIPSAIVLGGTIDNTVIGGTTPAAISGTTITATVGFVGNLTGNISGNAATATALQTARTIGGVSFNGTTDITVASATAGFAVSGGDLSVGSNNITSTGSLGSTGSRLTKGWFTDLQVTNAIAGSVTGNAATVTTNANLTGPITSSGNATSVTNNAITNNMLAQAPASTIKGNSTGSTANETDLTVAQVNALLGVTPYSAIAGFLSTSQTFTSSTIASQTITAGQATDSTNSTILSGGPFSWNITNGNAVNGYQGGTTLPNSATIHFFVIASSTDKTWTGSFASTSLTPTLPTGYTSGKYRRLFSLTTNASGVLTSGTMRESNGGGIDYWYGNYTLDINTTTLGTSRTLYTLNVPSGIQVQVLYFAGTLTTSAGLRLYSADEPDVAPGNASGLFGFSTINSFDLAFNGSANATVTCARDGLLTTSTSAQIAARATVTSFSLYFTTKGFIDPRRA